MKSYLFCSMLLIITFLFSCGTNKSAESSQELNVEEENQEVVEQTDKNYIIAKVVLSNEGCSVKLIPENIDNICYYPVNLEQKFMVDGASLQFEKYPSRAPMPSECGDCQPIQLENIVRLKR